MPLTKITFVPGVNKEAFGVVEVYADVQIWKI